MTKIKATEMVELQYYARETYGSMPLLCVRNNPPDGLSGRHDLRVWHPNTETMNIAHIETVEHLPGCTGWDWKPEPEPEPDYAELHDACGLKVGDRVRITKRTEPEGWSAYWTDIKEMEMGKVYVITTDYGTRGFKLSNGWCFPCTSLEKFVPKYRPFAGPQELLSILAEKPWVQLKASATEDYELITTVNPIGVFFGARTATVTLWDELFRRYQFEDGTPCGVLVEE